MADSIAVTVVLALPGLLEAVDLQMAPGSSVAQALDACGLLERHPGLELQGRVGIYGKPVGLDTPLRDSDRVEIYRPLRADPRESRRRRAASRRS